MYYITAILFKYFSWSLERKPDPESFHFHAFYLVLLASWMSEHTTHLAVRAGGSRCVRVKQQSGHYKKYMQW